MDEPLEGRDRYWARGTTRRDEIRDAGGTSAKTADEGSRAREKKGRRRRGENDALVHDDNDDNDACAIFQDDNDACAELWELERERAERMVVTESGSSEVPPPPPPAFSPLFVVFRGRLGTSTTLSSQRRANAVFVRRLDHLIDELSDLKKKDSVDSPDTAHLAHLTEPVTPSKSSGDDDDEGDGESVASAPRCRITTVRGGLVSPVPPRILSTEDEHDGGGYGYDDDGYDNGKYMSRWMAAEHREGNIDNPPPPKNYPWDDDTADGTSGKNSSSSSIGLSTIFDEEEERAEHRQRRQEVEQDDDEVHRHGGTEWRTLSEITADEGGGKEEEGEPQSSNEQQQQQVKHKKGGNDQVKQRR